MIGGRIVQAFFFGTEFRDSYSILPVPLKDLDTGGGTKLEISYEKMEADCRELHKAEILEYLEQDCIVLRRAIELFIEQFGLRITIASVALPMLRSFHGYNEMSEQADETIRPYYMGGRVQAFRQGVLRGDFQMIDANSMYPFVMANFDHPVSAIPLNQKGTIDDVTDFALIEAENDGALGSKAGGDLDFTVRKGTFFATGHEIRAGVDTGRLRVLKVKQSYTFQYRTKFKEFVDTFYDARLEAKARGDKAMVLFMKLLLNSSYGKFALNTEGYKDHYLMREGGTHPYPLYGPLAFEPYTDEHGEEKLHCISAPNGWRVENFRNDVAQPFTIFSRPSRSSGRLFHNVATAASITGAARAYLMRSMSAASNVVYCDTDSIICTGFDGRMGDKELGAWKVEATGDRLFIGGKKLYAFGTTGEAGPKAKILDWEGERIAIIKTATKGVNLTPLEIARVCNGEVIEYEHGPPAFSLDRETRFTKRKVRMTGKDWTAENVQDFSPQLEMFTEPKQ